MSVFNYIRSSTNNIFMLSETHTNESPAKEFSYTLWLLRSVWTAHSRNSAGVVIIVLNKSLNVSVSSHCPFGSFITISLIEYKKREVTGSLITLYSCTNLSYQKYDAV
jgi:hypothetical protein